jgi:hypothetical protein
MKFSGLLNWVPNIPEPWMQSLLAVYKIRTFWQFSGGRVGQAFSIWTRAASPFSLIFVVYFYSQTNNDRLSVSCDCWVLLV